MLSFDSRIGFALVATVFLEAAGGFLWAGRTAARIDELERAVAVQALVSERLARLEEQVIEARRSLARIEERLDRR